MSEIDLKPAIDAAAKAVGEFRVFRASDGMLAIRMGTDGENAKLCVDAAAPHIERAVREQVARELVAWADGDGAHLSGVGLTGPLATRRRTLHAAARHIVPKLTAQEVAEALAEGRYMACHLDETGASILGKG
jgi:hypothetical protein